MGYGVGTAEALENKVDKQAIEHQSSQRPCWLRSVSPSDVFSCLCYQHENVQWKHPTEYPQKNCMRLFIFTIEHGPLEGFQTADINCLYIETDWNLPSHIQILKDINQQKDVWAKSSSFLYASMFPPHLPGFSISTGCLEMFGVKSFLSPSILLGGVSR